MSKWTHIAGVIRFDRLPIMSPDGVPDYVREVFMEHLPSGSEGPCQVYIHKWPTTEDWDLLQEGTHRYEGGIMWADVIISADLRDFGSEDDVKGVVEAITSVCQMLKGLPTFLIVRQVIVTIEPEGDSKTLLLGQGVNLETGNLRWQTLSVKGEHEFEGYESGADEE